MRFSSKGNLHFQAALIRRSVYDCDLLGLNGPLEPFLISILRFPTMVASGPEIPKDKQSVRLLLDDIRKHVSHCIYARELISSQL